MSGLSDPTTDYAALSAEELAVGVREGWDYETRGLTPEQNAALTELVSRVASLKAELDEARRGRTAAQDSCNFQEARAVRAETALRELRELVVRNRNQAERIYEKNRSPHEEGRTDALNEILDRFPALAVSSASEAETERATAADPSGSMAKPSRSVSASDRSNCDPECIENGACSGYCAGDGDPVSASVPPASKTEKEPT